ncbi:MAG TPA: hypothetical protein VMS77_03870 [Conexivisphaerales archaeon]|nr:hypothetical protein [Conexivisphaerales archaeon]
MSQVPDSHMRKVSLREKVSFLMSIKEMGKAVTFDHIVEKVGRDSCALGEAEPAASQFKETLDSLVREGLLSQDAKGYYRRPSLDSYVAGFVSSARGSLNRSYFLVYLAERYYPAVVEDMLPFLVGRPLSAVKVFSDKNDPIHEVEPIFVRYSKYRPTPVHLSVKGADDVMRLVHDHCVDFIPYVHGFDRRPDVFLVDLDLGESLASSIGSLAFAAKAASLVSEILSDAGCHPLAKFSGNRGFQVLCRMEAGGRALGFGDLRGAVKTVRVELESRLQDVDPRKYDGLDIPRPYTTSSIDDKESRSGKILVDWSSMKPEGDYRAPLSLHHKTGLASVPLTDGDLTSFAKDDAEPLSIASSGRDFSFAKGLPLTPWGALASLVA